MSLQSKRFLEQISKCSFSNEKDYLNSISDNLKLSFKQKSNIIKRSQDLIRIIQQDKTFSVEKIFAKYTLNSLEGAALVALAESLIRIPDAANGLSISRDKILNKSWIKISRINSISIADFMSLGLFLMSKILKLYPEKNNKNNLIQNLSSSGLVSILKYVIAYIGGEFVIAENIKDALKKGYKGALYSFDLLGEAARTFKQADEYYANYLDAIQHLKRHNISKVGEDLFSAYNISVKLTALYPRVELIKMGYIKRDFIPKLVNLVKAAKDAGITISFDAEEATRLDVYLEIITALITHNEFKDFNGIGFVVQAYQKRAFYVIEYIYEIAKKLNKIIPVRLVKGAYWDYEIKFAQMNALEDYYVFINKAHTDANYIHCAKYMLDHSDMIYPQFATHNAMTAATIEELAGVRRFELQKLFGMGNILHKTLSKKHKIRIYAPIGNMSDLLAYLMRRMLENGANTSFVALVDNYNDGAIKDIINGEVSEFTKNKELPLPYKIFGNRDMNIGFDLGGRMHLEMLKKNIGEFSNKMYDVGSIINGNEILEKKRFQDKFRPGRFAEKIGTVSHSDGVDLEKALASAYDYFDHWSIVDVNKRADILRSIAKSLQDNEFELMSLLMREAGKTIKDAIAEIHEAVDFCLYYAIQAESAMKPIVMPGVTGEKNTLSLEPRGVFLCISPWNFPLAIFLGQVVAALVTGNCVIAKPADQTPIIANFVVKLMYKSGVPHNALHLVIAPGSLVGNILCTNPKISGIAFTGSNDTASRINLTVAQNIKHIIPIIAETGGQNAMIVDSSALLEQVTDDIVTSAFYSAGQRCSALRVLYIQEEIYEPLKDMIIGALATLSVGDNVEFENDIGPVIDKSAKDMLEKHIDNMKSNFNIIEHPHRSMSRDGFFVYPHIIEINNINDIENEKFGPILHIIKYKINDLDKIIDQINSYGYGLTFGIHTRIEGRVEYINSKIKVGNVYANRSMIGAQVESQPFGGRGLSGTGFIAGGPRYLLRFVTEKTTSINLTAIGGNFDLLS